MNKPRTSWRRTSAPAARRTRPSPLTTRHKVTEVPPPGPAAPARPDRARTAPEPEPQRAPPTRRRRQRAGQSGARCDVTTPRPNKAPPRPRPRHAWLLWAPRRTHMARELRTLLLWGCRLRAPALAVARGGEGGRARRVESEWGRARAELSGSRAPFLRGRRGDGSSVLGLGDFCEVYASNALRAANAEPSVRSGVTWLGPAPGCRVSPEVTGLSPGLRDCSRGFSPTSSSGRVEAEGSRAPRSWSRRHFRAVEIEGRVCAGKGLHQGDYLSPLVVFLFSPPPS